MLDNVLDATHWPLERQQQEAANKRLVGLGFTGLGDTLAMLRLRYDKAETRALAARISEFMRDTAYLTSVEPAKERGTISLAFADNASNGIEPPFSWTYNRKKRMPDGTIKEYAVEDYAWRLYKHRGGDVSNLPDFFVTALEISAKAHADMVAAVAPFVDTSISKTVNVPADYPYADFQDLYMQAWKAGLKGLATYRPNSVLGSVLSVEPAKTDAPAADAKSPQDFLPDTNRRLSIKNLPAPVLSSLRWPGRPSLPEGNLCWTYMVDSPIGKFALFVGHVELVGRAWPFEVWANGPAEPRGLGAVAKTPGDSFEMQMPPHGERKRMPSVVSAMAQVIAWRCEQLGAFKHEGVTPVKDALFSAKEPKTGTDGTLSWTVDVSNPSTGEDFVLGLKEITLPDGTSRPYSMWLSGNYPRALDGLSKLLSLDMRVLDPAWIGMKLRKLLDYSEPFGDFMAFDPGSRKQQTYPSTVAYIAQLIIHRYAMLGILDESGFPLQQMGILEAPEDTSSNKVLPTQGKLCGECGNHTMIRKDGCDFCTACGAVGTCGESK